MHSTKNIDPTGLEKIEENYYISGGYTRRYFRPEDIRTRFAPWKTLNMQEKTVTRYDMKKQIIEIAATI